MEILAAALIALLGIISTHLITYIKTKAAQEFAERVQKLATVVVQDTWETFVEEMKANNDGKLTKENAALARAKALEGLKKYLGPRGLKAIMYLIGKGEIEALTIDEYLTCEIHAALVDVKNEARASQQ